MREISLKVAATSRILIESGLSRALSGAFAGREAFTAAAAFVVTDENVSPLYLDRVAAGLQSMGWRVASRTLPPGEQTKSFDSLLTLYKDFFDQKLDRSSIVVALGGGVIGDLTGFAAATYMRGTRLLQVPTTLLAQVDAAIGGKVAVNHLGIKNSIGTFYQPELVIIDPEVLSTLPGSELPNGFAEISKAALVADKDLFEILEKDDSLPALPGHEMLEEIIYRAVAVKVNVVQQDERESGRRRVLNFGHTIGHALEESSAFEGLSHGEAVAVGMVLETRLARLLKVTDAQLADRIEALLARLGFKVHLHGASPEDIARLTYLDKKTREGRLVFALPVKLGSVEVFEDVDPAALRRVLEEAAS